MLSKIQEHHGLDVNGLIQKSKFQNNFSPIKNIVIANKGESTYMQNMDLNEDSVITLDEFSEYCEKNNISEEEKIKLIAIIANGKTAEKITSKSANKDEKENFSSEIIYARRGDKKYEEKMDKNKDSKITYKEYMDYVNSIEENTDNNTENNTENKKNIEIKKAIDAYTKEENKEQEIKIEARA